MKPVRLQRSRRPGAKLVSPNGLPNVYVGRPTKWGNPFVTGNLSKSWISPREARCIRRSCTFGFRMWLGGDAEFVEKHGIPPTAEEIRRELRGKNLVCWCPIGEGNHCHADVLLEIANGEG